LAVKLISEDTGSISLEGVGEVAEKAREEAERAAEEARSFKKILKAAEQGNEGAKKMLKALE